jgi:hypothetical protein
VHQSLRLPEPAAELVSYKLGYWQTGPGESPKSVCPLTSSAVAAAKADVFQEQITSSKKFFV